MVPFAAWLVLLAAPATTPAPTPRPPVVAGSVDGSDRDTVARALKDGGGAVPWGAIVIHHSGRAEGSASAIDDYQRTVVRDRVGLPHHVVIGNGAGSADGLVEVSGAWARGVQTPHLFRKGDLPPAISVALVGDLETALPTAAQLAALANVLASLAERFAIPVERVLTHREVEGRSTTCPGRLDKLAVLAAAGLLPKGPSRIRVEAAAGRVSLLAGDKVVLRVFRTTRSATTTPPLPVGTWPVCRRDEGGAFGKTVVIAYPGPAEIRAALDAGRLSPDESKRLSRKLGPNQCPPDDTSLGGEIAFHASGTLDEGTACVPLDAADADALFKLATPGTPVEIVP